MHPFKLAPLALAIVSSAAFADTITVVTSFPKELTTAYKAAYEKKFPQDKVEILNKGTSAGIAFVREQAAGSRPEIFWVSAPDAFEVLASEKLLQKVDVPASGIPAKVGDYPINDPEGMYRGQALAGYGMMWNTRYMQANKLPAPKEWADLMKPVYHGHVATSSPSRSGTTHLTFETILQGEGWDKGWNQILQISGNCASITERSFGVPDGVQNGQFGIGLVIDFFGLAAKASGFPTEFAYPSVTAIVPANIGLVAGAKSPEAGKRFLQFTLSDEGQQLLLDPKISRLPVLPATYAKAPKGYPNPFDGSINAKVKFDSNLSESRYYVVSSLFDQVITFRHKELVAATKAIQDAEKRLAGKASPQLEEAKKLAWSVPVSAQQAQDKELLAVFKAKKGDDAAVKRKTQIEEEWSTKAKANYVKAAELANAAK
ncbi:ABC transporter substrate-binding protein [Usitatibacter palustris]|uniref:Phosphoglycerate transport regulatory protein PgtC n=1 Tax=Usitatibacter palustris TaxID=2732487 RepID=A0A6M4H711_9PROT|nr:extracellular solute-binding protein [Usitatibacter palustris]QJR15419.1 Phosphoglycerate transport regulatory protein PgtC [Usitatibacter palustris]